MDFSGRLECAHCGARFTLNKDLQSHIRSFHSDRVHNRIQDGGSSEGGQNRTGVILPLNSALRGYAQSFRYILPFPQPVDYITFRERTIYKIIDFVINKLASLKSLKLLMSVRVGFSKIVEPETYIETNFNCKPKLVFLEQDVDSEVRDAFTEIENLVEDFIYQESGWQTEAFQQMDLHITKFEAVSEGSSFVPLPNWLRHRKALINIRNFDQKCFVYSVLSALYPQTKNPQRVTKYASLVDKLNLDGISFPVSKSQYTDFERQNNLTLNVFSCDALDSSHTIEVIYLSKMSECRALNSHVNLLLLKSGSRLHYCHIKNLTRLLRKQCTKNTGSIWIYDLCLKIMYRNNVFIEHRMVCKGGHKFEPRIVQSKLQTVKFRRYQNTRAAPYLLYSDFESLIENVEGPENTSSASFTQISQQHIPCSYGIFDVRRCCDKGTVQGENLLLYSGHGTPEMFILELINRAEAYQEGRDHIADAQLSQHDISDYIEAEQCYICQSRFNPMSKKHYKVRDHCHICSSYLGAAHNSCNLKLRLNRDVTVVFHGLRNYDAHIIVPALGEYACRNGLSIECLAKNSENYITFSLKLTHFDTVQQKNIRYKLRFIDSFAFLSASLGQLVKITPKDQFSLLREHGGFNSETEFDLALTKSIYPYEKVNSFAYFDRESLLEKLDFYSSITGEEPSKEAYEMAQRVWKTFGMTRFLDFHNFYLKNDVLQLADIFEGFRSFCFLHFGLDPAHYVSLPSFSWDAFLRLTGSEIQIPPEREMYEFIRQSIRGGLSVICNRYARANNYYLTSYNPFVPSTYIWYLDMNALYSFALSQKLPHSGLEWIDPAQVCLPPKEKDLGYFLEVDLVCPDGKHDLMNSFPLCPERREVAYEELSEYSLRVKPSTSQKRPTKLLATLHNKKHYILHYKTLMFYMKHGMKLKKIHRALRFKESAFMKPYIDFNTKQRQSATSKFHKDLFKLCCNSVFGKSLEDVFSYTDFRLVTNEKKLIKLTSSPRLQNLVIYNEGLVGVLMAKNRVTLNKPVQIGSACLDLAKMFLYRFYYEFLIPAYGDNVSVLMSDTDSLCLEIETKDLYRDMLEHSHLFDFSNYPSEHFLFSEANKNVSGLMKDETKSVPIREFVGLRAKLYSILLDDETEDKKAKGVKKCVTKNVLRHENFKDALLNERTYRHRMSSIRSQKHNLVTVQTNKVTLNPFDDKRFIQSNGIDTAAYGHYLVRSIKNF